MNYNKIFNKIYNRLINKYLLENTELKNLI